MKSGIIALVGFLIAGTVTLCAQDTRQELPPMSADQSESELQPANVLTSIPLLNFYIASPQEQNLAQENPLAEQAEVSPPKSLEQQAHRDRSALEERVAQLTEMAATLRAEGNFAEATKIDAEIRELCFQTDPRLLRINDLKRRASAALLEGNIEDADMFNREADRVLKEFMPSDNHRHNMPNVPLEVNQHPPFVPGNLNHNPPVNMVPPGNFNPPAMNQPTPAGGNRVHPNSNGHNPPVSNNDPLIRIRRIEDQIQSLTNELRDARLQLGQSPTQRFLRFVGDR